MSLKISILLVVHPGGFPFLRYMIINSYPGGYRERTSTGGFKFILTSVFEERGFREWTHMCSFIL